MRVLLLGAGGFIGRHILAELIGGGHSVTAVVRADKGLAAAFPGTRILALDLAAMTQANAWAPHLVGIDIVVNAAGILRGRAMAAIHVAMPRALHAACAAAGGIRVVLLSAVSARADVATDYARSKLAGEEDLRRAPLGWTVLRPSLVYGDGSYGGTSLLRGLAGLLWLSPMPGDGHFTFTPIHVRDLARAVRIACEDDRFVTATLEPCGPATLTLRQLLARYRAWLGFAPGWPVAVPMPVMRIIGRLGDIFGSGPIASNSLRQMVAGNAADGDAFAAAIGFQPQALEDALRDRPAQVQDRWHARLFFLAPALTFVLVAMWLASAWLGLAYGDAQTLALTTQLGLRAGWADPLRIGSSLLDLAVAALILRDRTGRWSTPAQCLVVLGYTLVIGLVLPALWLDPLGPLLKNLPVLLLILVHGATRSGR